MRKLAALRNRSPFAGDQPLDSISLCVYGDSTGLRYWNGNNDPMPINIAGGKSLEECVYYRGGGITVYTDNIVKVRTYEGFYDYFLDNQRRMSEIMMLPTEEVVKDKEYYDKLVNGLALQYNQQIENAPNLLRNARVLQDVNTPAPINFGCTVFPDGAIWIEEGYSVGTVGKPPCPVDVPSGKLVFLTNTTSETCSEIYKGFVLNKNKDNVCYMYNRGNNANEYLYVSGVPNDLVGTKASSVVSKNYKKAITSTNVELLIYHTGEISSGGQLNLTPTYSRPESFKQLLKYKALLTEQELKTELAKDIKLK